VFFDLSDCELEQFFIDGIGLGNGNDPRLYPKHLDRGKVFGRLRHPSFVGGDYEHANRYASRSRQHVLDETFVSGHIDDPDFPARRQGQPSKAEIDREAPSFLLLESVGVDAGEGLHQRGLPMIDVPGGPDYMHGRIFAGWSLSVALQHLMTTRHF
jgi:hypothetical protein